MKKKRIFKRILSGTLAVLLAATCMPFGVISFAAAAPEAPKELSDLATFRGKSETVTDRYGNPVHLHFYYNKEVTYAPSVLGKDGSVIITYVMNTNTKRIGTKSDAEIVSSMLDRGFYVIVMDYADNPVTSPDLDWSLQGLRLSVCKGKIETPNRKCESDPDFQQNYIVPSGYDIAYNVPYFSYDKHGSAGTLERIVEIWNNDFRSTKRDKIVKWVYENEDGTVTRKNTKPIAEGYDVWYADAAGKTQDNENGIYTKIGNTWADSITDCVKPDGSFIDLNLYADFIYPTSPAEDVPVMIEMSTRQTRVNIWTRETHPQMTGFLFSGYAGVEVDYGYVPMSRNDHYSYFSGSDTKNSVSGDNYTYSLSVQNGLKSDTALLRMVRKLAVDGMSVNGEMLTLPIRIDAVGVYGISKAGLCMRLGNPHPETLEESRHFEGHRGETRYESRYVEGKNYGYKDLFIDADGNATDERIRLPEEQPALTYKDGTKISSAANFVYANVGGGWETITKDNAPFYATGTQAASGSYAGFYRNIMNAAYTMDLPAFGLICPDVGHDYGHGLDRDYGIDSYYAFHRYANYYLKNAAPSCEIIDVDTKHDLGIAADSPIDHVYEIEDGSAIRLWFIGSIDRANIDKVTVTDAKTGEVVEGDWSASFRNQQWKFTPYDLKDNTYYRITVPETIEDERGNCLTEGKTLLFRTAIGVSEDPLESSGVTVVTAKDAAYYVFPEKDYTTSHETKLRLAVDNDAVNNLLVYGTVLADGETCEDVTDWQSVGEMVLTGAGTYTLDVTDFVKTASGRPAFKIVAAKIPSDRYEKEIRFVGENLSALGGSTSIGKLTLASIAAPSEEDEDALKVIGFVRNSSYVDLDRNLNGNYVSGMQRVATLDILDILTPQDRGRRFTVSFRVYDETSRLLLVYTGPHKTEQDTHNVFKTFYTTAGEWTDISFEIVYDDLSTATSRRIFYICAENKGILTLPEKVAVGADNFAIGSGEKGGIFAGDRGLNGYTQHDTALKADAAGDVSVDEENSSALYLSPISVRESAHTTVSVRAATLAELPVKEDTLTPVAAASVDSSNPDGTSDGKLIVGGGTRADDLDSRKLYFKLSLDDYNINFPAYFSFIAEGKNTNIELYGLANAADSDAWSASTVTARTAPANDYTSGSLNMTKVYGGAPLATYTVSGAQTITADISAYATAMKAAGAKTLTLILVSADSGNTVVGGYDFEGWTQADARKNTNSGGFNSSSTTTAEGEALNVATENGNTVLVFKPTNYYSRIRYNGLFGEFNSNGTNATNKNHNWTTAEIGDTYRITFKVRSDKTGNALRYGLMRSPSPTLKYESKEAALEAWNNLAEENKKTIYFILGDEDDKTTPDMNEKGTGVLDYSTNFYPGTEDSIEFKEANRWYTCTLEFTVTEGMMAKTVYQIDKTKPSQVNLMGDLAVSLLGFISGYSETKNLVGATVQIDDIQSVKLSGQTKITPISNVTGTHTFDDGKWTIDYLSHGGTSSATIRQICEEKELNENGEWQSAGNGNKVFYLGVDQYYNRVRFNGLFGNVVGKTADPTKINNTDAAKNEMRNYNWTTDDIGRSFRITFKVKSSRADTYLLYGMMRGYSPTSLTESTNYYTTAEYGADAKNYSDVFYGTGENRVTFTEADKWYTVSMEFTVDENMLAKEVFDKNNNSLGMYAISLFGIRTNGCKAGDVIQIDDICAKEIPSARYKDFSDLTDSNKNGVSLNGGFSTAANDQNNNHPDGDQVIFRAVEEDGNIAFGIRPYDSYHRIRFSGLFGENNVVFNNAPSSVKSNHGWTDEEIGDVWRVTFRAKSDTVGAIRYGLMRGAACPEETVNYSSEFYGTSYTADFAEKNTWYTFTMEFTVDENMKAKVCGTSGTYAISYFAFKTNGFSSYTKDRSTVEGRPTVLVDDIVAVKIGHTNEDGSITKNDRTNLSTADDMTNVNGAAQSDCDFVVSEPAPTPDHIKNLFFSLPVSETAAVYGAKFRFYLEGAKGQTLYLYSLGNTLLPSSLTWGNAPTWKGDPIATLTVTADGWQEVDITALAAENIGKTLTFVLVANELDTDLTVTPTLDLTSAKDTSEVEPSDIKVKSNITLSSDFIYNVYVPALDEVKEITLDGAFVNLYELEKVEIDGKDFYRVSKKLAAKDGSDASTVKVLIDNGKTQVTKTYVVSIPKYATKLLASTTASKDAKTVVIDAVAYIKAAKAYFGEPEDTALDALLVDHVEKSESGLGLTEDKKVADDSGKLIDTSCLNLGATPAFVFYLKKGIGQSVAESFHFTTSVGGASLDKTVGYDEASGRYFIEVTAYAYGMKDALNFTYKDGNGTTQNGSYNLAAYYVSSEPSAALVRALAQYADSAKAYRESVIGK